MKKPVRKVIDYIILTIVVSAGILLILNLNGNPGYQKLVILLMSLFYVLWGVMHHYRENSLHMNVMLEYIFYAILGSVLVIGLL